MAPNGNEQRPNPGGTAAAIPALVLWLLFPFLLFRMPPDGHEHGSLAQFFGRFHPVLVHLPIAILALVPVMEFLGRRPRWTHLLSSAGWLLSAAALLAFVTAFDGWLLAWSGGYRGHDVTRHMWVGAWLAAACGSAAFARSGRLPRTAYPFLMTCSFGLMIWAAHTGGSISHGDGFLTDKMPARIKAWLGLSLAPPNAPDANAPAGAPALVHAGPGSAEPSNPAYYAVHIAPILTRSCQSCHKAAKHKGGLRLDSYELLMRGGADGPVVVPGNPKTSEILRRVRLPSNDDDSMPSDGDKPLTIEEIQMLERWIAAGAKSG
jgi:uncharacterized membrane protein